ncbi:hypothetical protein ABK040_006409 [Willaertia magna]
MLKQPFQKVSTIINTKRSSSLFTSATRLYFTKSNYYHTTFFSPFHNNLINSDSSTQHNDQQQFNKNIGSIYIERTNIGIFGAMNSGKSTLMNCLTKSNTSIVDSTPGTTADVKVTMMELHQIGSCKIMDTPGTDESSILGEKKREKTIDSLKESNICIIVIDPFHRSSIEQDQIETELGVNEFDSNTLQNKLFCGTTCIDLESNIAHSKSIKFIEESYKKFKNQQLSTDNTNKYPQRLLPKIEENGTVFLNIPMDEETPSGRLLKPQAMVHEYLLREYNNVFSYRMNLKNARSNDLIVVEKEKQRFLNVIKPLIESNQLKLLITDSQAIDIIHPWTIDNKLELIDITTFSVIMINFMSNGRLNDFMKGIEVFKSLQKGDSVLICEACNHNRIADDIGTVQIPNAIQKRFGKDNIGIDHVFGREYQLIRDLTKYKLIIHCGGCMIDKQKMNARLNDLSKAGVPITNYGLLLSFLKSEEALQRVVKPFSK